MAPMTRKELLQLIAQAEREGWKELNLKDKGLTELPPEIGNLTQLTSLHLSSSYGSETPNQLTGLPSEIGRLTNLTELVLYGNKLTELPSEIGRLTNLTSLSLGDILGGGNELTALPPEIGSLTNLTELSLSENRLTALPLEIGSLTNLTVLGLRYNQLAELPPEIGRLTNLTVLGLDDNQLIELPPEIGCLINLTVLGLDDNQLAALPPQIGRLTNLTLLYLNSNRLTALPSEIGRLTNLTVLYLDGNQLTALPPEIGRLTNLTSLNLGRNQLTALPPEIGRLTNLTELVLYKNKLTALPPEIGRLTNLTELYFSGNQLTELPAELGKLRDYVRLGLDENPWSEPFAGLVAGPQEELFAYLRSLLRGVPQYEAKVLLVGEGAVGKTCLLAALREEEFIENRPTTHGIEIKQVAAKHPDASIEAPLRLNFWDFGGQEVYRITHQFFFSRQALYLLVWKPREGQEENALEGWLERIHLRVGDTARVLIVATHCQESRPELDYPALQSKYGAILAGHCTVDNLDGTGIPELRARIAEIVSKLEHVGTPFNKQWLAARDEIKELDQTHVTYAEFGAICQKHGLDATDTQALIGMLHTLGQIIYYDSDGLRDFVVLKPEWLTKAIGYVLEDGETRAQNGVLDHRRLNTIWSQPGETKRESYPPRYFPYFLRLMEQYDVSARLEGQDASLIPQMVPYQRPSLPWETGDPTEQGQLSLVCQMDQNPPGLIAWTTVRNHRWSTGKHWRNGVFLQHEDGHQALVDFVSRLKNDLSITVRGEYPAHFMSLIHDGLKHLIDERWPHLTCEMYVPCPTRENRNACPGHFPLKTLYKARAKGIRELRCQMCLEEAGVGRLLEGYAAPAEPLSQQLVEMEAKLLAQLRDATIERQAILAQSAEMTRRVLRALLDQARRGPRLFSLYPIDPTSPLDPRNLLRGELKLALWCEHPGHEHALEGKEGHYIIPNPREWVGKIAPYALLVLKVLRVVAPLAGGAVGLAEEAVRDQYKPAFDFMGKVVSAASEARPALEGVKDPIDPRQHPYVSRAEGAGLRAFHDLLEEIGWKPGAANLRRVTDKTGDVLWVCPAHYKEYDPGLPVLPEQW